MSDNEKRSKRRWIDIKNNFKKSWGIITDESNNNNDNTEVEKLDSTDFDKGFKKPGNSLKLQALKL